MKQSPHPSAYSGLAFPLLPCSVYKNKFTVYWMIVVWWHPVALSPTQTGSHPCLELPGIRSAVGGKLQPIPSVSASSATNLLLPSHMMESKAERTNLVTFTAYDCH
ncbi:hypothetical protein E2C01_052987 [Portunus trituberculatus]|uniref:Uncharacterized protein n=1 Tax=Portunus trituberculatus TaxID=210409 RepID=A0A5B7GJ59_PORTR|nr:hypothetical protein [Portunus trituberculatus]